MPMIYKLMVAAVLLVSCSDADYQGGGRRRQIPNTENAGTSSLAPGEPASSNGGSAANGDAAIAGAPTE